jgi:poly(3-hydroxyalkanoate) synthetase
LRKCMSTWVLRSIRTSDSTKQDTKRWQVGCLEESENQTVHMQEWVDSRSSRRFPGQLFATCTAG